MREINELKNIANMIANHFGSRKTALSYLKNIHLETDRMKLMNDILPSGIESLGITESRIVLRHLDERYDNCGDEYTVGVKNTKTGEMVIMKINHTKRLYCEVLSRALNKRGPEYREIIRNRLDRMLEMRHLSLETTDFNETNEISNIILKVWQDIDDAKPDNSWLKRGVDKSKKQ